MPTRWSPRMMSGVFGKVAGLLGADGPWITFGRTSSGVFVHEIEGRTYVMDLILPRGRGPGWGRSWAVDARALGRGTLTTGGTGTEVMLTEVTDPAVKHQVVIAYAARKPTQLIATGDHRHLKDQSTLVVLGLAKDDTPEGLAAAVPHVAVFEVTPA